MDELNKLGESFSQVKSYREIQGSPYFNEEFSDGRIVTKDDKSVFLKLRYNIYSDEIEFLNNDKIYSIAKPVYIKEFCIGEQKIRFSTYLDGKFVKNGFLLVLTQGDYTLFVKKRIDCRVL